MKRYTLLIMTVVFTILNNVLVFGEDFQINVIIKRPAIFKNSSDLRDWEPSTSSVIRMVPASDQMVEVYQSNWSGPQLCASYWTDAQGTLDNVTFSCGGNLPNEIQIVVRGQSQLGFRVGTSSPYPHEFLEVVYDYNWYGPWVVVNSDEVDYPTFEIGSSNNFSDQDFKAAALVELLSCIYQELDLNTSSKWIINSAYAATIGSTQPWVYWNIVHMNAAISGDTILNQAPHELGHVLYNVNHSGKLHYDVEDWMDYLIVHNTCTDYGYHFGAYEGYAHAFRSLFWRHHAQRLGKPDYADAKPNCGADGIGREGNVNEFYSYAFAGIPMERPPEALHDWTIHRIGANEYLFPPTDRLFTIVNRVLTEDISEMWNESMCTSECQGSYNGVPTFCGSRRFKCLVKNSMIKSNDSFPSEFKDVDCRPGISSIVNTYMADQTTIRVNFTPADLVDEYYIIMTPDGGSPIRTVVDISNQDVTSNLSEVVSAPTCSPFQLQVETVFNGESEYGLAIHLNGIGPDSDNDNVLDLCDNCPSIPNNNQEDSDGDGIGNACDLCPGFPSSDNSDIDGDGIGNPCDNCPSISNSNQDDSDWDGVGNACDLCPDFPSSDNSDIDGDGIGNPCDPDRDNDGIANEDDKCPDQILPQPVNIISPSVGSNWWWNPITGCAFRLNIDPGKLIAFEFKHRFVIPCDPLYSTSASLKYSINVIIDAEQRRQYLSTPKMFDKKQTFTFTLVDHNGKTIVQKRAPIIDLLKGGNVNISFNVPPVLSDKVKKRKSTAYFLKIEKRDYEERPAVRNRKPIKFSIKMTPIDGD